MVVKLGSSIVAADEGELRVDVLDSVCEQVAGLQQGPEHVVMVTSGAIARGVGCWGWTHGRARWMTSAASAVGQDVSSAPIRTPRQPRHPGGAGAPDRRRYRRSHQLPKCPQRCGGCSIGRWCRINESTTATDEISFGDNDFLAAQAAVLLDARLLILPNRHRRSAQCRSAARSRCGLDQRGRRFLPAATSKSAIGPRPLSSGGMRSKVAAARWPARLGFRL